LAAIGKYRVKPSPMTVEISSVGNHHLDPTDSLTFRLTGKIA
jgi:hypothetical protein